MSKRVRISNDSLNSYGTRVLTSGMDVAQYCRNPVLLYQHERGTVIGYVKDLKVEDNEVTGELMFDEASELSKRCKKQYEFGSLRMVSAGIDILEMSEEKELLVQGQTSPTITKSKLFEAPGRRKDPVWEELAEKVYSRCMQCRSVIAFSSFIWMFLINY